MNENIYLYLSCWDWKRPSCIRPCSLIPVHPLWATFCAPFSYGKFACYSPFGGHLQTPHFPPFQSCSLYFKHSFMQNIWKSKASNVVCKGSSTANSIESIIRTFKNVNLPKKSIIFSLFIVKYTLSWKIWLLPSSVQQKCPKLHRKLNFDLSGVYTDYTSQPQSWNTIKCWQLQIYWI